MNSLKLFLLGLLWPILFASPLFAQQHNHVADVPMIDGAQHPELIPDSTAYRLFLITVAETSNPTPEQKARQLAFLKAAGLADDEIQAVIPVLATFKAEYTNLIRTYNDSVPAANANGTTPDLATFLQKRDQLVQFSRDALTIALSAQGMANFDAHVQREKLKMKVAKEIQ